MAMPCLKGIDIWRHSRPNIYYTWKKNLASTLYTFYDEFQLVFCDSLTALMF